MYYYDGIIFVGFVNWSNIVSFFSFFIKENMGIYFLIFVYGNLYKNDKEFIIIENKYKSIYDNIKSYIDV